MLAREIMTTPVVTVGLEAGIREITELLLEKRISAVPVVDGKGQLAGIVSEGDLIHRAEIGTTTQKKNWWLTLLADPTTDARQYVKTHGKNASDLMTSNVVTIVEQTSLSEIAQLLEEHKIKRLPVVKEGRPIGIVSRANILQALTLRLDRDKAASPVGDQAIKAQIYEVLEAESWSGLHELNVAVSDGVVQFWGIVESADRRHALLLAAEAVDGVKVVEDHLAQISPTPGSGYA
jgi:CBS domain-containing protein